MSQDDLVTLLASLALLAAAVLLGLYSRALDAEIATRHLPLRPPRVLWARSARNVTLGLARLAPLVAWTRRWKIDVERSPRVLSIAVFIGPLMFGARWDRPQAPPPETHR